VDPTVQSAELSAELLAAAIGQRRLLEPTELKILQRDRDQAAALPRKIASFWRGFFADDDLERQNPLPEGFDWPFLRDALLLDRADTAAFQNVASFDDLAEGAAFVALTTRLREKLRAAAPIRYRQAGAGLDLVEPSEHEMAKFRRLYHVIDDPMQVLHDTASGIVSLQQVATMRSSFPLLYRLAVDAAFDALAHRLGEAASYRVPWHKDVPLRRFFGASRWTGDLVVQLQQAIRRAAAEERDQAAPLPRPLPMAPERLATPVERITAK
jgi:hypothetical protein